MKDKQFLYGSRDWNHAEYHFLPRRVLSGMIPFYLPYRMAEIAAEKIGGDRYVFEFSEMDELA